MKRNIFLNLLFCALFFCPLFSLEKNDEIAIHTILNQITDSWNVHQGLGFGNSYCQNADFVNIFGNHFSGKEEIEKRHIFILRTFLKDSIFTMTTCQLREVTANLVLAHVSWDVTNITPSTKIPSQLKGIFTHVFIKENDQWKITASQNTLCKEDR